MGRASKAVKLPTVRAYTDGSCDNRTGLGGYGLVRHLKDESTILSKRWIPYRGTTNNRMELMPMIVLLESLRRPSRVIIATDSQYCITVASKRVCTGIKNSDLWARYMKAAAPHIVSFVKVKGHVGIPLNEMCDELAGKGLELARANHPSTRFDDQTQAHGAQPMGSLFAVA